MYILGIVSQFSVLFKCFFAKENMGKININDRRKQIDCKSASSERRQKVFTLQYYREILKKKRKRGITQQMFLFEKKIFQITTLEILDGKFKAAVARTDWETMTQTNRLKKSRADSCSNISCHFFSFSCADRNKFLPFINFFKVKLSVQSKE